MAGIYLAATDQEGDALPHRLYQMMQRGLGFSMGTKASASRTSVASAEAIILPIVPVGSRGVCLRPRFTAPRGGVARSTSGEQALLSVLEQFYAAAVRFLGAAPGKQRRSSAPWSG